MDINLDEYKQVKPSAIEHIESEDTLNFIDITVEDNHTFHIYLDNSEEYLLSHNCDGHSIAAQLMNLFYTYWPDLFKAGKVMKIHSPIVEARKKGSKEIVKFYTLQEFNSVREKYTAVKYNKGLGSLSRQTYKEMILKPRLDVLKFDESTEEYLEMLFGKSHQEKRRQWINK